MAVSKKTKIKTNVSLSKEARAFWDYLTGGGFNASASFEAIIKESKDYKEFQRSKKWVGVR